MVEATFRVPFFAFVDFAFARTFFAAIGPSSSLVSAEATMTRGLTIPRYRMRRAGV